MEVRTQSKSGPVVSPLPEVVAQVSRELDSRQREWLKQLRDNPGGFAHLEQTCPVAKGGGDITQLFKGWQQET